MKRIGLAMMAFALVMVLSQCKKNEETTLISQDEIVPITLDVSVDNGSRIYVNPNNGSVSFTYGDMVYVASGGKFVGTLTRGTSTFSGNLTNPTVGEPLYFYFLGNKTPAETLTAGSSTQCSVSISDQTNIYDNNYPVISYATSNETFTGSGLYTAFFLNKCALVKFNVTTASASGITCIKGMNNKVIVDFSNNSVNYDQVDDGLIKLDGKCGDRWAILLPQAIMEVGEEGTAYSGNGDYIGVRPAIPAISENDYYPDGIELMITTELNHIPAPEGAIDGHFTINDNGDWVFFSKGNLQYQASTNIWKFAENQYDYVGDANSNISQTYSGWIDLFGWGTSGYDHGAVCYQPWSTNTNNSNYYAYGQSNYNLNDQTGQADWGYNAISNGGNQENLWRTLTAQEWDYLVSWRSTASGINSVKAIVNGVNGAIIVPDNWIASTYPLNGGNNYDSNVISAEDWTNILETNGAVFLPAAGYRYGSTVTDSGSKGYYWPSSYWDGYATNLYIDSNQDVVVTYSWYGISSGYAVRLARPVE